MSNDALLRGQNAKRSALACLFLALSAFGCKKNDQDAQTAGYQQGQPQPGTTQPGTTQPGTTQPGTTQPGTTQPGTTQPGTTQPGTTQPGTTQPGTTQPGTTQPGTTTTTPPPPAGPQVGAKATPLDATAGAVAQPILNELAKKDAVAGSKPVGTAMVGNFSVGSVLETQVQLQPNKCYTVVATSLPGVTELNLQLVLVAPLPGVTPVLAADSDVGTNAVIGRKPNCYKWALPLAAPAKVVITVASGSGLAAAQLYEK